MEKISLIMDSKKKYEIMDPRNEQHYAQCKEFLRSIGIASDCVGWCTLDPEKPDFEEKMRAIRHYTDEQNFRIRCWYEYEIADSAEWYVLHPRVYSNDAWDWRKDGLQGYKLNGTHLAHGFRGSEFISDRFRKVVERYGFTGWQPHFEPDVGKYAAPAYFCVVAEHPVLRLWSLHYPKTLPKTECSLLGSHFTFLCDITDEVQNIDTPAVLLRSDLPTDDVSAYCGGYDEIMDDGRVDRYTESQLIIRRRVYETLKAEHILTPTMVRPLQIVDTPLKVGELRVSSVEEYRSVALPASPTPEERAAAYQAFLQWERPQRAITDAMAQKRMRVRKKEANPTMKKGRRWTEEQLPHPALNPLLPYYKIAAGGYLSDEICLLTPEEVMVETVAYVAEAAKEETVAMPCGLVIAKAADGDVVILAEKGVCRVSHEDPSALTEWPSVADFIYSAIEESDKE